MLALALAAASLAACGGSRLRVADPGGVGRQDLQDDFGLDEDTWLGLEDAGAEKLTAPGVRGAVTAVNMSASLTASYPPVLLLGMFNTGTNLLRKLLSRNFPGLDQFDAVGDLKIWKHAKPEYLHRWLKDKGRESIFKDHGVVVVAVTRDPMSWLMSMRKAPYDLSACMYSAFWTTRSCFFPAPTGDRNPSSVSPPVVSGHTTRFKVENIESVWNEWTWQYDHLVDYGFVPGKTVVLSYEDIALNTTESLARIASAMGVPAPATTEQVNKPAKLHGHPNGREAALRKLRSKSYLGLYRDWQRHNVCERLSKTLMHLHGYDGCDGWL